MPPGAVRIAPQVVSRFCAEDAPAAAVVRVLMVEVPPALRVMMPANHHEWAVARNKCKIKSDCDEIIRRFGVEDRKELIGINGLMTRQSAQVT